MPSRRAASESLRSRPSRSVTLALRHDPALELRKRSEHGQDELPLRAARMDAIAREVEETKRDALPFQLVDDVHA